MNVELGKKYQTRDGRAVRILATDFKAGATCVIGTIIMTDTNEIVGLWNARGEEFGSFDHLDDLIPVPTKHEGWCLVDTLAPTYLTRARAERAFDEGNYAVTPIGNPRYRIAFYAWED